MQNKEKMERLAALSLLVLGIMLVFAVFDANRVNQRLSELQQTVDYGQQLEKLLFPNGGYPATAETAETAESAEKQRSEPVIDFTVTGDGIVPSEESYIPVTLNDITVSVPLASAGQGECNVTYRSGSSTAAIGDYRIALVEGEMENSIATFKNSDKEILSGARTIEDGITLTVAAEVTEGCEPEQKAAIEKMLADATITDTFPQTTILGEVVKENVVIETDDGYLQMQQNKNIVLLSTFSLNVNKDVFDEELILPNGLMVRYGDIKDEETGYIPFVCTINDHNVKILATSIDVLQNMFAA